ncbi:SurA N-terminal domain-containing protein [Arcobacter sp. FWKO B]|uniref:SurA N-terminal domain-containing protein n=1 Tax=Arcobacter sp. FWKO B TaxID=2593672 RepID=UPI0018A66128|nr:SurA N-terminal domain-containing protein [Arcobacter sp. FWKO B]QOG12249.1 hypothetical protein FWKOB_05830 [Arcobacter sp. FWKO B]
MKKIVFLICLLSGILSAGLINAVAVIVNEKAITLNELQEKMDTLKVSKEVAIGILVEEKLYEEELKRLNISVDSFEVNEQIRQIASNNDMDLDTFKRAVTNQYGSYEAYTNEVRNNILHSKLTSKVARGNLVIATDNDIKLYYENNLEKFSIPRVVDIVEYSSRSRDSLGKLNSSQNFTTDVSTKSLTLETANINPELRYILLNLKENELSPILNASTGFVRLKVVKKRDVDVIPMDMVKEKIFQDIMMQREQNYLKEYFDKLKISADIVVLR